MGGPRNISKAAHFQFFLRPLHLLLLSRVAASQSNAKQCSHDAPLKAIIQ
jgi:hypothetical protein